MPNFVRVAGVAEIKPGGARRVEIEGHEIALFNVDGRYCAVDAVCPHRGGPVEEGTLDGEQVTCPWHGAVFNVTTGTVLSGPAPTDLRAYPVRLNGENIEIEV